MRGKLMLYRDQYGRCFYARTLKELCEEVGHSHISKMYIDKKDGPSVHVGYVVGPYWLTAFVPYEGAV